MREARVGNINLGVIAFKWCLKLWDDIGTPEQGG